MMVDKLLSCISALTGIDEGRLHNGYVDSSNVLRNYDLLDLNDEEKGMLEILSKIVSLTRRRCGDIPKERVCLHNPEDVYAYFNGIFSGHEDKEYLYCCYLDNNNYLMRTDLISVGTSQASLVDSLQIFRNALLYRASNLIFVHNHLSYEYKQSIEDTNVTKQLVSAGKQLNITVLDHVILYNGTYVSLRERNVL